MAKSIGARANGHQRRTSKPLTVFVKAVMSAFSMVSLHFGAKTANSSSNASSNASRRNSVSCDEALFTPGCPAGYLALMEEPTPSLVPPSPRAATPFEINLPEDLYGFANSETNSPTSPHSLESADSYSAPSYAPTVLTTPSEVDSDADEAWMSGFAAGIADTTAYLLKGSCAEREQKLVARVAELNACQHQYQIELMQAMDIQAEVQQWENYLQDLLAQAACLFPDGEEGALQAALHIFNSHEAKEAELRNASIYHFEEVAA